MTQDKFVRRSLRQLSDELAALGHEACPTTVADLLRGLGYNLRVNRKRITGPYHPERDRQFGYIEAMIEAFRTEGLPILRVCSKRGRLRRMKYETQAIPLRLDGQSVDGRGILDSSTPTGWPTSQNQHA